MKKIIAISLVLLSFIPLLNLLHPGLPLTHDGQDHVARIANFYQNLQEGNIVPRWASNLNWGYGHPVMMFLYPLPSYLASLFHLFGFSFVDSTKLVFAFAFIGSILAMYLWLKSFLSEKAAFVGALLYGFAPYHFVDLYIRGAIGELVAFIFPPLVLYFILRLSQKNTYWCILGGSLSLAAFILSHNAMSLMFLPILIFYIFFLSFQNKRKKVFLRDSFLIFVFSFTLSAFFWLPAFIEGKYTLRDIVTLGVYRDRFSSMTQLLYGSWNYGESGTFTVQVGLLHWLGILGLIPFLLKTKKSSKRFLVAGLLFFFLISLFLMTSLSGFVWQKVTLLQKFQFPWRFLFLTMFTSSVIGAVVFNKIPVKWQKIGVILFIIVLFFLTKDMWHPKGYLQKPESFYTAIYNGTTDTGESSPIWSVRFMEERPKALMEVIGGQATIQEGMRSITKHTYTITDASDKAQLRENTLYFPGWQVLVDGKEIPIQFQDTHNRGVITFLVEKGQHDVVIQFKDTKLRQWAAAVSIGSLFLLLLLGILGKKKLWQS